MKRLSFIILILIFINISWGQEADTNRKIDKKALEKKMNMVRNMMSNPIFDGRTFNGWKAYNQEEISGWAIEDNCLAALNVEESKQVDLITIDQYENFVIMVDWTVSKGGNSGILYHVMEEDYKDSYFTGPEYQIIDEKNPAEPLKGWQKTAALYGIDSVVLAKNLKPAGQINTTKIRFQDGTVEHWLNNEKILTYELWTEEWNEKINNSIYKDYPDFGTALRGHIALQHHGNGIKYSKVIMRSYTDMGTEILNDKELTAWKPIDGSWYYENGYLVGEATEGSSSAYLLSDNFYQDYTLRMNFMTIGEANGGIFFRTSMDDKGISGLQLEISGDELNTGRIYETYDRGWLSPKKQGEKHLVHEGQWNELVMRVKGNQVIVWLNGRMTANVFDEKISETDSQIALQVKNGENAKIWMKDIYIKEIKNP